MFKIMLGFVDFPRLQDPGVILKLQFDSLTKISILKIERGLRFREMNRENLNPFCKP